jgi:hypothetical protein
MGTNDINSTTDLAVILEKINALETRVEALSKRIAHLGVAVETGADLARPASIDALGLLESGEGLGEWLGKGALLQKVAIICFILVFALLLRTVADYGYVNDMAGSFLGLGYVGILAAIGVVFYVTGRRMANVFALSGFLLLFAIVFEGYGRFETISLGGAYAILLTALLTSAAVGIKYRGAGLLAVSLIGVAISCLALGFPRVHFPLSGLLLLAVNVGAIIAAARLAGARLKWPVTMLTLLFWALWAFKVYVPLDRGRPVPAYLYPEWLLPLLVCFVALYFVTYLRRYFSEVKLTAYDAVIPSLNVLLLLLAGGVVIKDYWRQPWLLGLLALIAGLSHLGVGWRLSRNDGGRLGGSGGAFVAGAMALGLAVSVVVGSAAWSICGWALLAYGLARFSGRCDSGVIRLLSYLYLVLALLRGLAGGLFAAGSAGIFQPPLAAAASLALFGFLQFSWCRHNPPPAGTLFARLDRHNHSPVVLLLVGLGGLYLASAMILDAIASLALVDPVNTMRCGRSIFVNVAAASLLIVGGRRQDWQLLGIAIFIGSVGCLKVFLVDLFSASGLPLVLSVLSFGVVAMVGSIIMGRWSRPPVKNELV